MPKTGIASARGIFRRISRFRSRTARLFEEALADRGVTGLVSSHGAILTTLYHGGGRLRMADVTRSVGKTKSTVTQLVDALERAGFARRVPDPDDGRGTLLALTAAGRRIRSAYDAISADMVRRAWEGFTPAETGTFLRLFSRLEKNMGIKEDS